MSHMGHSGGRRGGSSRGGGGAGRGGGGGGGVEVSLGGGGRGKGAGAGAGGREAGVSHGRSNGGQGAATSSGPGGKGSNKLGGQAGSATAETTASHKITAFFHQQQQTTVATSPQGRREGLQRGDGSGNDEQEETDYLMQEEEVLDLDSPHSGMLQTGDGNQEVASISAHNTINVKMIEFTELLFSQDPLEPLWQHQEEFPLIEGSLPIDDDLSQLPFLLFRPAVLQEIDESVVGEWRGLCIFLFEGINYMSADCREAIDNGQHQRFEDAWVILIEILGGLARQRPRSLKSKSNISEKVWLQSRWMQVQRWLPPRFFQDSHATKLNRLLWSLRVEGKSFALASRRETNTNHAAAADSGDWQRRTVRKVAALVGQGRMGAALNALTQDGPPPPLTPEALSQLKALHPPEPECGGLYDPEQLDTLPPVAFTDTATITAADLQALPLSFFQDRKAPGPSGINGGLIAPIVCLRPCASALALLSTVITSGRLVLGGKLETLLGSSRLIGLPKPGGGLRPVAVGEYLLKVSQKLILARLDKAGVVADLFPTIQLGIGSSGGVEKCVLRMQTILNHNTKFALMQCDARNAFNRLSRRWMEHCLAQQPTLRWLYPSFRHFISTQQPGARPKHLLSYNSGVVCARLQSQTGVPQGGALSSLLFCIAMQPWYERIHSLCSKEQIAAARADDEHELWTHASRQAILGVDLDSHFIETAAVIDDLNCAGSLDALALMLEVVISTAPPGYELQRNKTSLLVHDNSNIPRSLLSRFQTMEISTAERACRMLGSVVGWKTEDMRIVLGEHYAARKRKQLDVFWERVEKWSLPLQIKLILLRFCVVPNLSYAQRTLPYTVSGATLRECDDRIAVCISNLLSLSAVERARPDVRARVQRSTSHGGMGFTSAAYVAPMAYTAALTTAALSSPSLEREFLGNGSVTRRQLSAHWNIISSRLAVHPPTRHLLLRQLGLQNPEPRGQTLSPNLDLNHIISALRPLVVGSHTVAVAPQDGEATAVRDRVNALQEDDAADGSRIYQLIVNQRKNPTEIQTMEQRKLLLLQRKRASTLRLQKQLTQGVWAALAAAERKELSSRTREAMDLKEEEMQFLARHGDNITEEQRTCAARNAERVALKAGTLEAASAAKNLPGAALIWSTLPSIPELRVRDKQLVIYSRGLLGLPPVPGMLHCGSEKHEHAAFAGLNGYNNAAYSIDVFHHQWCKGCTRTANRGTIRHNELASAIRSIAIDAGCTVVWEPSLPDTVSRAQVERIDRDVQPPRLRRIENYFLAAPTSTTTTSAAIDGEMEGTEQGPSADGSASSSAMAHAQATTTESRIGMTTSAARNDIPRRAAGAPFGPAHLQPSIIMGINQRTGNNGTLNNPRYAGSRSNIPADPPRAASTTSPDMRVRSLPHQPPPLRIPRDPFSTPAVGSLLGRGIPLSALDENWRNRNTISHTSSQRTQTGLPPTSVRLASSSSPPRRPRPPSSPTSPPPLPAPAAPYLCPGELEDGDWQADARLEQQQVDQGRRRLGPDDHSRREIAEGDLAISGPLLPQLVLVDVHVVSLTAPSRVREWMVRSNTSRNLSSAHLLEAEMDKRRHYRQCAASLAPTIKHNVHNPLQHFDIDFVPAVASANGVLGGSIIALAKKLAEHKIGYETMKRRSGDLAGVVGDHLRQLAETTGRYKRILATAIIRASTRTMTAHPVRLDRHKSSEYAFSQPSTYSGSRPRRH